MHISTLVAYTIAEVYSSHTPDDFLDWTADDIADGIPDSCYELGVEAPKRFNVLLEIREQLTPWYDRARDEWRAQREHEAMLERESMFERSERYAYEHAHRAGAI